ncbi:hypothetical protein Tco_0520064 [Tanacetum coccineum]
MTTLAEFMIIAGANNRPPMLEKSLYDSWKRRIELYMENRENGRMILDSVRNGPLVWLTVAQEDGPLGQRSTKNFQLQKRSKLILILNYQHRDDPIACLNKAMAFPSVVAASRFPSTNNQLRTSSNPRNQTTIQDSRVTMQQV